MPVLSTVKTAKAEGIGSFIKCRPLAQNQEVHRHGKDRVERFMKDWTHCLQQGMKNMEERLQQ